MEGLIFAVFMVLLALFLLGWQLVELDHNIREHKRLKAQLRRYED